MQALWDLAASDPKLKTQIIPLIEELTLVGTPPCALAAANSPPPETSLHRAQAPVGARHVKKFTKEGRARPLPHLEPSPRTLTMLLAPKYSAVIFRSRMSTKISSVTAVKSSTLAAIPRSKPTSTSKAAPSAAPRFLPAHPRASTKPIELRDGDKSRYLGKGVLKAVGHVNGSNRQSRHRHGRRRPARARSQND